MQDHLIEQFQEVGTDLVAMGLTTSHGGNMSVRQSGRMIITAHFAMLGRLGPGDLVDVPLGEPAAQTTGNVSNDAALLQTHVAAMVRGHGCYVVGRTLGEAQAFASALGLSCHVAWLMRQAGDTIG
ncbi:MAG: class II aldolase/adducin family protein [Thermoleophilia bacterium]